MVDVDVALAWVAISGVSLKWLSALGQRSAWDSHDPGTPTREDELLSGENYSLELIPVYVGGSP
jgi:hypothetical protein